MKVPGRSTSLPQQQTEIYVVYVEAPATQLAGVGKVIKTSPSRALCSSHVRNFTAVTETLQITVIVGWFEIALHHVWTSAEEINLLHHRDNQGGRILRRGRVLGAPRERRECRLMKLPLLSIPLSPLR